MYGKEAPESMVTVEEAVKLSEFTLCTSIWRTQEILGACEKAFFEDKKSETWYWMKVFSLMYDVGRLQGIREERAKKRFRLIS